jgi:hypothetical protein
MLCPHVLHPLLLAGLFNTLYYTVAFVFVWFTVANVPSGANQAALGYSTFMHHI